MTLRRRSIALWLPLLMLPTLSWAVPTCTIDSVVPVSFGGYDVFSPTATDGTGSVTYTCSGAGGADVVAIELSTGGGNSFSPRALAAGINMLDYNLYLDASRSSVWGDTTGGTSRYSLTGTANNDTLVITIYGRIPAQQNAKVGSYSDTVTVTVLF
jgi:spore coat protein U-like protein